MALVAARPATATPIYNNLNSVTSGTDPASGDGGLGPLADSFSTGSSGYSLAQVGLKLWANTPLDDPGNNQPITIALLGDSSTAPGNLLYTIATLYDGDLTTSLQDYFFTLATPYTLAANTRYWIEVSEGAGSAGWSWSLDQTALGVAGEYQYDEGFVFSNSEGPYQMLVTDTPLTNVPEPGRPFALVVAFGMLAGVWFGRRRLQT